MNKDEVNNMNLCIESVGVLAESRNMLNYSQIIVVIRYLPSHGFLKCTYK